MTTLVLYYSLSGTTQSVARNIAQALDTDLATIRCARYRPGVLGYALAGFDSLRGHLPEITLEPEVSLEDYDRVVLGSPIWTSYLATPVRAALSNLAGWPRHVALFVTAGGQGEPDKALNQAESALSHPLDAQCRLTQSDLDSASDGGVLDRFVAGLDQAATAQG
ncbi:flavodoxin family protein [Tropicimonas sp. S265A]|uniref:flavodoxin family protein n=1 Tax=Tropicimonas sp. S265A TaxID=3415134 RepID=UPI003C79FBE8